MCGRESNNSLSKEHKNKVKRVVEEATDVGGESRSKNDVLVLNLRKPTRGGHHIRAYGKKEYVNNQSG